MDLFSARQRLRVWLWEFAARSATAYRWLELETACVVWDVQDTFFGESPSARGNSRLRHTCRLSLDALEDRTLLDATPATLTLRDLGLDPDQGVFADQAEHRPDKADSDVAKIVVYSGPDQGASAQAPGSHPEAPAKRTPLAQEADKRQKETHAQRQSALSPGGRAAGSPFNHSNPRLFSEDTLYALGTALSLGNNSAASPTAPVVAAQAALIGTMTGLSSSANPSMFLQTITLTATVTANTGPTIPGGAVDFIEGGVVLGSGGLDLNGQATFSTNSFSVGSHSLTAVYRGDGVHDASTSAALSQTVTKADTTTSILSMEPNPSVFGEGVRIHAIVTPVTSGAVTGLVTFKADGATVATYTLDLVDQGEAIVDVSTLSVGSRTITVEYAGDDNYNGSTSSSQTQTVTKAETSTALGSSPNPSTVGEPVTFTATVSAVSPGAGTPTGTVDFKDGANTLGTETLNGGQATFVISSLPAGMHTIGAVYGGSASFLGSTGEVSHTVEGEPPPPTAATHLTFSVQPPSSTPAGEPFSVTVQALDDFDNVDTSFAGDITISIGTNPGAGNLSGTLTVTAMNGEATFADLKIDKAGMGYTLLAASGNLLGDESMPFEVTAAAAHHLAFAQQPSTTVAGEFIDPPVTVFVEDRFDNVVVTSTADVAMAIGANPGGGTLSGTRTVKAVDGIATFRDLSINKVGVSYTLVASSSTLVSAESFFFDITAATAHHLAFAQQPSTTPAGHIIDAVTVFVEDQFDNLVTTATPDVTIAIGENPVGGNLRGTLTVTAVDGVATFDDLSIDKAGVNYTLVASSSMLLGDESVFFDITLAPALPRNLELRIDPVAPETEIDAGDALNSIINPAAIVIESAPTPDNVAVIELTNVLRPRGFLLQELQADDPRVVWTITNTDADGNKVGGAARAAFFAPGGVADNLGRQVRVHGVGSTEGRIVLEARRADNNQLLDFFEAFVVKKRQVFFRVNLLVTDDGLFGTDVDVAAAKRHIQIANVILRQAGVALVPDPVAGTAPKGRADIAALVDNIEFVDFGFFKVTVNEVDLVINRKNTQVGGQDDKQEDAKKAMRVNDRDGVVQINYIEDNFSHSYATELNQPGNRVGVTTRPNSARVPGVHLTYRATIQNRSKAEVMDILPDQTLSHVGISEPSTWGLVMTNKSATEARPEQFFGNVVAHEVSHVFNLRHRVRRGTNDDLPDDPPLQNLMSVGGRGTQSLEIDLIQLKTIGGSRVFFPLLPPIGQ